jgi:alkanesulfonate monooxygenase SsuD/methylene tetrahydromethanopterin reductase-like flavin-dependent oxidoreductase (luciferase family)
VKFGLFNLMSFRNANQYQSNIYSNVLEQVQLAEQIGFDTAWFAEHHFTNYSLCPSPLMMAAHCAAATSTIKLAPGVLIVPLYQPLRLLGELAMVDQMSGGRLVVGLGSGYQHFEFDRFNVDISDSVSMLHEQLDLIELAYANDRIEYHGTHYQVPETPLCLRPTQSTPDVCVAGLGQHEATQMRMAKKGYLPLLGAGPNGTPLLRKMRNTIDQFYINAGIPSENPLFSYQSYVHITDSKQEALRVADNYRWVGRVAATMRGNKQHLSGTMLREEPVDGEATLEEFIANTAIGTVEEVAEKLSKQIAELRPSHVTCFMQPGEIEHKHAMNSLQRFGAEVIPMIENEIGPLSAI